MQAHKVELADLFGTSNRHLYAPVFQRRFVWGDEQLEQLWEDVQVAAESGKEHLLGTVVVEAREMGSKEYMIVDGQQRLTSLSLMLKAAQLRCLAEAPDDAEVLSWGKHLLNRKPSPHHKGELEFAILRVCPALKDRGHYYRIVVDGVIPRKMPEKSRIPAAFKYFADVFKNLDADKVRDLMSAALSNFIVLRIQLDAEDDACAAFANINGLGLQLSPAELSKNYILSNRRTADAERLNATYWKPLEDDFPAEKQQLELIHVTCTLLAGTTSKTQAYSKFHRIAKNKVAGLTFASEEEFLELFRKIYLAYKASTPGKPKEPPALELGAFWWIRDNLLESYGFAAKLLMTSIMLAHIQGRLTAQEVCEAVGLAEEFLVKAYFNDESHHASTYLAKSLKELYPLRGVIFIDKLRAALLGWAGIPDLADFVRGLQQEVDSKKGQSLLHYVLLRIERYLSGLDDLSIANTQLSPLNAQAINEYGVSLRTRQLIAPRGIQLETRFELTTGSDIGVEAARREDFLLDAATEIWGSTK